ncbi:hypothetical protein HAX54_045938, partial [Datura stramonium]|nr:hypothetical protein [Datura stramonium]
LLFLAEVGYQFWPYDMPASLPMPTRLTWAVLHTPLHREKAASHMPTRYKVGNLAPAVESEEWHLAPSLVPILLPRDAWKCAKIMAPRSYQCAHVTGASRG